MNLYIPFFFFPSFSCTYLPTIMNDIHKSSIYQSLLVMRPHVHPSPKLRCRLFQPRLKFMIRTIFRQTIIISTSPRVKIRKLDPTARAHIVVSLSEKPRPVCYAATHGSHFDEIEGFGAWEGPRWFAVVDLKLKVDWDPGVVRYVEEFRDVTSIPDRLDGTQIESDDFCWGMQA